MDGPEDDADVLLVLQGDPGELPAWGHLLSCYSAVLQAR